MFYKVGRKIWYFIKYISSTGDKQKAVHDMSTVQV